MPKRIDALHGRRAPVSALAGRVLDDGDDPVLQEIVGEATKALDMPIGLVSLVLDNTQYFRAQTGLPEDLAITRATDRDVSFCQFVLRDGAPVSVHSAGEDADLPQLLVEEYGIESYLGVPVKVGPTVIGTLCVLDVQPREFDPEAVDKLQLIAARASERLTYLAGGAAIVQEDKMLADVTQPSFAEIRNKLTPLAVGLASMRIAVTEVTPILRILQAGAESPVETARALGVLERSQRSLDHMRLNVESMESAYDVLMESVAGLEALIGAAGRPLPIIDVIKTAVRLASHDTKVAGGVRLAGVPLDVSVAAPAQRAIGGLALALSLLARQAAAAGGTVGLSLEADRVDGDVFMRVTAPGLGNVAKVQSELHDKLPGGVVLQGVAFGVELRVPAL